MNNIIVAVATACAVATVTAAVLWLRARAEAARATERARAAEEAAAEAARRAGAVQADLDEARRRVAALEPRTWLEDFPADAVFTLLARGDIDGDDRHHGVLRDEQGRTRPFLTARAVGHLEPGDTFAAVRGQLVKLDAADLDAPPATPAVEDTVRLDTRAARTAPDDATVAGSNAGAPPAGTAGDRTVYLSPDRTAGKPAAPDAGLPFLEVIEGPDEGRRFPVPFASTGVGRDPDNVVTLSDSGASRVHCLIDYEPRRFVLRDNHSTNGTLCNDERVSEQELAFGDVVHVADTRMRWSCEGFDLRERDPAAAVQAFEQTLAHEPDFVAALKNLAFLLEKDIARKKDAQPLWDRLAKLEP